MTISDSFIKLYGTLRNYWIFPIRMLTPLRWLIRIIANRILPVYFSISPPTNYKVGDVKVIVSLTSFPARINNVWQVIECMKRQTLKPQKIFLWLSKEQFSDNTIPCSLRKREDDLFEIRLVDGDLRSHKKYIYVCQEYSDSLVFLVDDDIYYPSDIIEKSIMEYKKHPNSVICNYGHQITFDEEGKHRPYSEWIPFTNDDSIFFGSGGGTLFRPSDMYFDLVNKELALSLTPTADDIWLNAMARLSGMQIFHSSNRLILPIINDDNTDLSTINNGQSQNDIQIEAIENYYGRYFDKN